MNFDDTTEIVDTYIDAVDTDLDKDKIKVQMRELMTEAQALDRDRRQLGRRATTRQTSNY